MRFFLVNDFFFDFLIDFWYIFFIVFRTTTPSAWLKTTIDSSTGVGWWSACGDVEAAAEKKKKKAESKNHRQDILFKIAFGFCCCFCCPFLAVHFSPYIFCPSSKIVICKISCVLLITVHGRLLLLIFNFFSVGFIFFRFYFWSIFFFQKWAKYYLEEILRLESRLYTYEYV